ncbi:MAG TPA: Rieske (2Fe-2S) protein [Terracidiphilus sp.]|nr:Rieske (2Fe-2S) protein [Terracidiphilus sp.]
MEPTARIAAKNEQAVQIADRAAVGGARNAELGQRHSQNNRVRPISANPTLVPGSRRGFLRAGVMSLGALALWLMDSLARREDLMPETSESTLETPWDAAQEIHFYQPAIVVNGKGGVAVFSSTCPHLGCRINRAEGRELVCPCHGSRFSVQGDVEHGPATRGLRALPFALDGARRVLRVTLGSSQT